jgi:hypothetical protein
MPYRDISSAANFGNAVTGSVPTLAVTGDVLYAITLWGDGGLGSVTVTPPSGWSQVSTTENDGTYSVQFWKLNAAYSSGSPPSLGWSSSNNDYYALAIVALSGRSTGAETFGVLTGFGTPTTLPYVYSFTGGTAGSGDDLLLLWGNSLSNTDTLTYTNATGFTDHGGVQYQYAAVGVQTRDSFGGGATGSASFTADDGFTFHQSAYAGIYLAIPSATTPPVDVDAGTDTPAVTDSTALSNAYERTIGNITRTF